MNYFSGSQQGLQGEAAYRLGLAYEMTGDGKTALLVSFLPSYQLNPKILHLVLPNTCTINAFKKLRRQSCSSSS